MDQIHEIELEDCPICRGVGTMEDEAGWCDGTGSRLVCHGVGETGRYDFEPVVAWAAAACPGIPCVVENSVPATAAGCLTTLERMSARCEGAHREM